MLEYNRSGSSSKRRIDTKVSTVSTTKHMSAKCPVYTDAH